MTPATPPVYRNSHLDPAHARDYDVGFTAVGSIKRLNWQVERAVLDRVLSGEFGPRPTYALDVATGTGRVLASLAARIGAVGVDVSPAMLAVAAERVPCAQLLEADVTSGHVGVGELGGRPDLVTLFRFLLNAEPDVRRRVLAWIRTVVAPNGLLVVNTHLNPRSVRGRYLRLRWRGAPRSPMLSPADLRDLLTEQGFRIVATVGYEFLPYRRDGERLRLPQCREWLEERLGRLAGSVWAGGAELGGAALVIAVPDVADAEGAGDAVAALQAGSDAVAPDSSGKG